MDVLEFRLGPIKAVPAYKIACQLRHLFYGLLVPILVCGSKWEFGMYEPSMKHLHIAPE